MFYRDLISKLKQGKRNKCTGVCPFGPQNLLPVELKREVYCQLQAIKI